MVLLHEESHAALKLRPSLGAGGWAHVLRQLLHCGACVSHFFSLGLSVLIWNPGLWADKREASSSTSASNMSSQSL